MFSKIFFLGIFHISISQVIGQCRKGWVQLNESCYLFADVAVDWSAAEFDCVTLMGGYLAEIESANENTFLRKQAAIHYAAAPSKDNSGYWIGGADMEVDGDFLWMKSRHHVNFNDWIPGEPNGAMHENCMHLYAAHDFHWNDSICSQAKYFVCERSLYADETEIIG